MADTTLRFDIVGDDNLSGPLTKAGASAGTLSRAMDIAARSAKVLDDALARQRIASRASVDATLALAAADKILAEAEHGLTAGALAAELALKKQAEAAKQPLIPQVQTASAVKKLAEIQATAERLRAKFPEFTVKIDDAAAKARLAVFAAQAAGTLGKIDKAFAGAGGGGILGRIPGFGGGAGGAAGAAGATIPAGIPLIGGLGPVGATAAVAAGLTALPFIAQAAGLGIVSMFGAATAGMGIIGAARTKSVQASFAALSAQASLSLTAIGSSFVPVMRQIATVASATLGMLTPVFTAAAKAIAGPFQRFATTLTAAFGQPAVQQSILAVATAFGKILTAVTPALTAGVGKVAGGITEIANNISKMNPNIITHFANAMFDVVAALLDTIAWLIKVGNYVEQHFGPAMHRVATIFDGVRHDVVHIWDLTFQDLIGSQIRFGHNVETQFNSLRRFIAGSWDQTRHDAAVAWDALWNSTVARVIRGIGDTVRFFTGLPGKIVAALGTAGTILYGWGKGVIQGMLDGFTSILKAVENFFTSIPKKILGWLGHLSPPKWAIQAGRDIMNGLGIGIAQAQGVVSRATAAAVQAAATGALGGGGPVRALMQKMAAARGWTGGQWNALDYVEMREAGYNLRARNPSSGAYGLAQFINGPSEYYQWGGNPNTAAGQITGMLNYIAGRYGSPASAAAHERAFNWYGGGLDAMFTRPTLIGVGERGPEHVQVTPAGQGDGLAGLAARLDRIAAQLERLIGTTAAVPAATGRHVGGALAGAGADAAFRRRYPG